eukprot:COSAG06_NODE_3736_length_4963_cov_7.434416_1_plen_34_part_00
MKERRLRDAINGFRALVWKVQVMDTFEHPEKAS